jgi:CHAT domain-containing protein/tetratricopeptide (TPR) repeat protein
MNAPAMADDAPAPAECAPVVPLTSAARSHPIVITKTVLHGLRVAALLLLLLPGAAHVQPVASEIDRLGDEQVKAFNDGDYRRAAALSQRVLDLARAEGEGSQAFASALHSHGVNIAELGQLREAERLLLQAVALRTTLYGANDSLTVWSMDRLAYVLAESGKFAEAETLMLQVVAHTRAARGDKHPELLTKLNALAYVVEEQGRYSEAEKHYRAILDARREVLGEKHARTIISYHRLAMNLMNQGRYTEADPLLRREVELTRETAGAMHRDTTVAIDNLARNLRALGRYEEAEPLLREVVRHHETRDGLAHPQTAAAINELGLNLAYQGRTFEADNLYRRALELRRQHRGEKHADTVLSLLNVASALNGDGRYTDAEVVATQAFTLAMESMTEPPVMTLGKLDNLVGAAVQRANSIRDPARADEAERIYRAVLSMRTNAGQTGYQAVNAMRSLAGFLQRRGKHEEAETLYRRVLDLTARRVGASHPDVLDAKGQLGWHLTINRRYAEAEPLLRETAAGLRQVHGATSAAALNVSATLALDLLLQPERALQALQPAREVAAGWRARRTLDESSLPAQARGGSQLRRQRDVFTLFADAAWVAAAQGGDAAGLRAEAFEALQDAMAGSAGQAVALMAARSAAAGAGERVGALARERQSLVDQWRANEEAQTRALAEGGPEAALKRANLRSQQEALEARMAALDEELRKSAPEYFALIRPAALPAAAAQQLLGPDEAALVVVPTFFGTHVVAVTREGLHWSRSALDMNRVGEMVDRLRAQLDPATSTARGAKLATGAAPRRSGFDRQTAHTLYQQLVQPVAGALQGKSHVFIAAAGSLASLPFGVLVSAPPTGDDADAAALRDTRWFGDDHALVQIPSLQSLAMLRRSGTRVTGGSAGSFVGFGDPLLGATELRRDESLDSSRGVEAVYGVQTTRSAGGRADLEKVKSMPRLPGTAVELENLRRALDAPATALYLRERATETAVRSADLARHRVVAFATHGLLAGEVNGVAEPALVLTPPATATEQDDGLLTVSEVSTLKLNADWVILSACNTAAGEGGDATGLSGLARAFFFAGARALLVSHWPVRDDVAAQLTVDAIARQQANPRLSRAQALQAAMKDVRTSASDPSRAHPAAWAPFSLVGDAR